jgi:hypothetical protein
MTKPQKRPDRAQVIRLMEDCASSSRTMTLKEHFKKCELVCHQYLELQELIIREFPKDDMK